MSPLICIRVPDFNGFNFNEAGRDQKVLELSRKYDHIRQELTNPNTPEKNQYQNLPKDPYLSPKKLEDQEALLKRYLIAENFNVEKAAKRLKNTALFRKEWDILSLHDPNAGYRIIPEKNNPGSESYFADSLMKDKLGAPWMVARLKLCSEMNMHPWRHLRAALFWIERAACRMQFPHQQWCYLIDIAEPGEGVRENVYGPTASKGDDNKFSDYEKRTKSRAAIGGKFEARYGARNYPENDEIDANEIEKKLIQKHGPIVTGLQVLKLALELITAHYPDLLKKVFFVHSNFAFFAIFKIFSLWVDRRTRSKFMFVGKNTRFMDYPMETLFEYIDRDQMFLEYGGIGRSDKMLSKSAPE